MTPEVEYHEQGRLQGAIYATQMLGNLCGSFGFLRRFLRRSPTQFPSGSVFGSDYFGQFSELLGSYQYEASEYHDGFHMYSLTFTGNPGYLKPIEIDTTLDGVRPTTSGAT